MYRYLDRPVTDLDAADRLLLWSMRNWVATLTTGRCPCAVLRPALTGWHVADMLPDFNIAMLALNRDGQATLRFGAVCCGEVSDDEARLLALFDASRTGDEAVRRLAAHLVQPHAVGHLAIAAGRIAAVLAAAAASWQAPGAVEG